MNLKDLQSQMDEATRMVRRMKEAAGVLDPHPGVRQAIEEMNRVRAHLADAHSHLAQFAFPPSRLAVELAESLSMVTARTKPIMDQMPRLGLDLPAVQAIHGLDIEVAKSMLQIHQVFDNMPRLDLSAFQILRGLDQVPAITLPPLLREREWLQAVHSAAASMSAASLSFPDVLPDEIADLVGREFAAVSMEVAADTRALEGASVLEFALALLRRMGDLRRDPQVQNHIFTVVATIVAAIIAVEWELYRTRSASGFTVTVVDQRERSVLPQLRGKAIRTAHVREHPDRTSRSFGVLAPGDELLILGRDGDWLRVMAGLPGGELKVGWVYARLVKALVP
jgi:hypothetical protein